MPTKYLVLRANETPRESFAFSSPKAWGASEPGPTDLIIHTADGHEGDEGRLRADPRNVAVMDAEVVLSLIRPKAQTVGSAATLKQVGAVRMPPGLVAVGAHTTPFTGQGVTVAILDT